jgi:hypothetical protein
MDTQKLDVSVILPIKTRKEKDFEFYFDKAIASLKTQKFGFNELIIVNANEEGLNDYLSNYDFGDLDVVIERWDNEPSFAKQINHAVAMSKSKWISILEFDDEYSVIWFDNVNKFISNFKDVDVFLPIVIDVDNKDLFAGFTNEATFAANFTQEMGVLTTETLLEYQNFQTSGAVMKKSIFEDFGGFKSNFKLTFVYEFLLRMTYNSVKFMTIPKIGYKHMNLREDSIFWNYKNGQNQLTENEANFWIQTAKREYFFKNERDIVVE